MAVGELKNLALSDLQNTQRCVNKDWKKHESFYRFGVESIVHSQEYFSKLSERTVAYINVDISVFGTS